MSNFEKLKKAGNFTRWTEADFLSACRESENGPDAPARILRAKGCDCCAGKLNFGAHNCANPGALYECASALMDTAHD